MEKRGNALPPNDYFEKCNGDEPLVTPERPSGDFRDVAFASSALLEGGHCRLYDTVADAVVHCATVELG